MDYMYAQTPLKRYALLLEDKMMAGAFGHLLYKLWVRYMYVWHL